MMVFVLSLAACTKDIVVPPSSDVPVVTPETTEPPFVTTVSGYVNQSTKAPVLEKIQPGGEDAFGAAFREAALRGDWWSIVSHREELEASDAITVETYLFFMIAITEDTESDEAIRIYRDGAHALGLESGEPGSDFCESPEDLRGFETILYRALQLRVELLIDAEAGIRTQVHDMDCYSDVANQFLPDDTLNPVEQIELGDLWSQDWAEVIAKMRRAPLNES